MTIDKCGVCECIQIYWKKFLLKQACVSISGCKNVCVCIACVVAAVNGWLGVCICVCDY